MTLSLSGPSISALTASSAASASEIFVGSEAGGDSACIAGRTTFSQSSTRGYWLASAESTLHSATAVTQSINSCTLSMEPSPPNRAHHALRFAALSGCATPVPPPRISASVCVTLGWPGAHFCTMAALSLSLSCFPSPRLSWILRNAPTHGPAAAVAVRAPFCTICVDTSCRHGLSALSLLLMNCLLATLTACWQLLRLVAGGSGAADAMPAATPHTSAIPTVHSGALVINAPLVCDVPR